MGRPNNWRDKRDEQHQAHNRKAGRGKWWKHFINRRTRRRSNKIRKDQVEGRSEIA